MKLFNFFLYFYGCYKAGSKSFSLAQISKQRCQITLLSNFHLMQTTSCLSYLIFISPRERVEKDIKFFLTSALEEYLCTGDIPTYLRNSAYF